MTTPRRIPQEQVDRALDAGTNSLLRSVLIGDEAPYRSVRRTAALVLADALDLIDRPLADAMREESRRPS